MAYRLVAADVSKSTLNPNMSSKLRHIVIIGVVLTPFSSTPTVMSQILYRGGLQKRCNGNCRCRSPTETEVVPKPLHASCAPLACPNPHLWQSTAAPDANAPVRRAPFSPPSVLHPCHVMPPLQHCHWTAAAVVPGTRPSLYPPDPPAIMEQHPFATLSCS